MTLPGEGLAGAAEDRPLLFYAGLKRETPDRPEPGVPHVLSERVGKLTTNSPSTRSKNAQGGWKRLGTVVVTRPLH